MNVITKSLVLNNGREITIETGKLAKQADGSVVVRMGNTMILAAVVSSPEAKDGIDFLPLSVDYQEKFASAGRIPGGFLKREGRLSDHEILVCRLVDRAIRPLFPSDYHSDTQIMIQLISHDDEVIPDTLAALAASSALAVSDIPFLEPISEVRVARVEGEYVVNPTPSQLENSDIDIILAATKDNILMVEGEMNEVSESEMLEAMKVGHEEIKKHCAIQEEFAKDLNIEKRTYSHERDNEALAQEIKEKLYAPAYEVTKEQNANKKLRTEKFNAIKEEYIASFSEEEQEELDYELINKYYNKVKKEAVRNFVLDERVRLDGRQLEQVRPIWSEVSYLPSAHGSAVFTRGETQSLSTVTLGTKLDEKMIDGATISGNERFMLHYNFPGFSTGEVRPNRGPGRREVGHGNLAYRALKKVLPEKNPYTIRIVSDILESNGSSSMATVCAGTLALMDAGIQISAPVTGIAMGLISDFETGKYAVLSDILGDEDHLGDMDFKVTGTAKGITACQMDIKVDGLSYEVLTQALEQARDGRLHILNEILKTIEAPSEELKAHAPRIFEMQIDKEFIGAVIGPGGKVIQEMQKESGTTITIEEVGEYGVVNVFGPDKDSLDMAINRIKGITARPEVGEVYDAKVKSIVPYGAFVEFLPGKEGLLHISEIKWERLENMDGVLEEGEVIKVKLTGIDKRSGKAKLSRKVLLSRPPKNENPA
ncbi:MAG: polyribonucleotide nucleotidyltransferase [Cytophagales bacterium]|nr:polyribonucleotide nucleotidyltransferase [Cytophagales bacterium]